ncbi:MAG: hypothetical protein LBC80_07130 [Treponema sp.]|jgi:hypothetical protein|nr:hypothetical protein [Treponema sp.]
MKKPILIAAFLCGLAILASGQAKTPEKPAQPLFNWNLLWSGSWEENRNVHNRGEFRLHLLPAGLMMRTQILDRRPMKFDLETYQWNPPWGEPEKAITHFTGGLYHRPTGSRLLYGVIDEWGLPARIRNVWLRSPPYAENHRPLMADLRITSSSTREDEVYLYLSSPFLDLHPSVKLRSFVCAQTQVEDIAPAFSGGLNFVFSNKTNPAYSNSLLLEGFYTSRTLPVTRITTWFSDPPRLPEREFHLYAAGLHFANPAFALSSDFALSETFGWGEDIYCNLGVTFTPLLSAGRRARPLAVSFAADGAGGRFVNRDGVNLSEGFRNAAKIEWRGRSTSLLRLNTVLRSNGFGEEFNRSSTGFYYRFPAVPANRTAASFPIRFTRISLSADRNAVNPLQISDSYSGSFGFNINGLTTNSPLRMTFTGTIKGTSGFSPYLYPIPFDNSFHRDSFAANCELYWSPQNYQFRSRIGAAFFPEKEDIWDFSISMAIRFKQGRLSLRAASLDFPEKWNWTISWRLEKSQKN